MRPMPNYPARSNCNTRCTPLIGGWVRFDHVYGSAVVIKYQQPYAQQALAIGRMLENVIKAA